MILAPRSTVSGKHCVIMCEVTGSLGGGGDGTGGEGPRKTIKVPNFQGSNDQKEELLRVRKRKMELLRQRRNKLEQMKAESGTMVEDMETMAAAAAAGVCQTGHYMVRL